MERDIELIKTLLIKIGKGEKIENNYPNNKLVYHLLLLINDYLIGLTPKGKTHAHLMKDKGIWGKTIKKCLQTGFTMEILRDLLIKNYRELGKKQKKKFNKKYNRGVIR